MARPEKEPKTEFAKRLRLARKALGYEQLTFSEKLGVAKSTYAGWEQGKNEPPISSIIAFSKLHISADWLITGKGEMFTQKQSGESAIIIDHEALTKALKIINEAEQATDKTLPPEEMARPINIIYGLIQKGETEDNIIHLFNYRRA